jgi:hypothetical protein
VSNLESLKIKFEDQLKIVTNFENDLSELERYIKRFERDLLSIKMYKSEISSINSTIKSIDSTKTKYFLLLSFVKYAAATKGLELEAKIKQEQAIKQQNLILLLEREFKLENQPTSTYTDHSTDNYTSDYSNYLPNRSNRCTTIIFRQNIKIPNQNELK